MSDSDLPPSLVQAYLAANYCVGTDADSNPAFVLKAGVHSEPLAALFQRYRCDCAAYLTACNPLGQDVGDAQNAARQADLSRELHAQGLRFFGGVGQDGQDEGPDKWTGEPSFLILGLSLEASQTLGRKHEQNALIWCAQDAVPQLVLLR